MASYRLVEGRAPWVSGDGCVFCTDAYDAKVVDMLDALPAAQMISCPLSLEVLPAALVIYCPQPPQNSGGIGNARWTGALLRDVLASLWPQVITS